MRTERALELSRAAELFLEVLEHTFLVCALGELPARILGRAAFEPDEDPFEPVATVKRQVTLRRRKLFERRVEVDPGRPKLLQHGTVIRESLLAPRCDGSSSERLGRVGNHELLGETARPS